MHYFFVFYMLPEFYRRILDARFALLVSQSVNFTIDITFLEDEKKQPLNNTSPPAGYTRTRISVPRGCNCLFYSPDRSARISHRTRKKKKIARRRAAIRRNIAVVIDRETVISHKQKYASRNELESSELLCNHTRRDKLPR